jgi:polysaccharide export outer membrane protein
LDQSAYLNESEIARLPQTRADGITATTFRVPLDSSYLFERAPDGKYLGPPGLPAPAGPNPDVTVQPYDNVLIMRQPSWELQRTAAIAGEVRFPGKYTLKTKTETIKDLIDRAGGLTSDAYPNGVVFSRANIGRIGIDLPDVLRSSRSPDNLPLQDGDALNIPRFNPVVNVTGAVNSPLTVTYSPGKGIDFYVRAAGGPGRFADVKHAYVAQPNGKVESRTSHFLIPDGVPQPQPGSTVYVPTLNPLDKPFDLVGSLGLISQVVAGLATLIIAARH